MYRELYAEVAADDQAQARRREYRAFEAVIERLGAARDAGGSGAQLNEALDAMEALWSILAKDVAHPQNGLPDEVRRGILSIARWIFARSADIRNSGAGDIDSLIEMNATIRDGLKAR